MYERILLSTDGSIASDAAETHAIELAAEHDATLHVLFVIDEGVVNAYSGDEYVDEAEGPEHGLEELGEKTLAGVRKAAAEAGVETVEAIRQGDPATTIVAYADDEEMDMLVLGTKRRADEYRTLLGSVTDRVLRLTSRPAAVIKTEVSE
jgi:nucleotide-binding universal stress UspA family protein